MTYLVTLGAAGVVVGAAALALAVAAWTRLGRLRRELAAARSYREPGAAASPDVHGSRATTFDAYAIRSVAVVRYDALQEMAGRLSFSLALLSAAGDGVVVSSINGRTETRTYAKVIRGGKPTHPLSPEEERAVREARHEQMSENGSLDGPPSSRGSRGSTARPASGPAQH